MKSILIVRNGKSGVSDHDAEIDKGIEYLKSRGYGIRTLTVEDIKDRASFDQIVHKGALDVVVATGGDGTVNMLLQYLVGTDIALAVVPAGTFNHFSKHIGIGTDIAQAFEIIATGECISIDTASINGKAFVNFSCVGFYTEVIRRRMLYQKKSWKKWTAFIVAAYDTVSSYSPLRLTLAKNDIQATVQTPLIFVGNNIFEFGGADILKERKDFTSGKLQLSIAAEKGKWNMFLLLCSAVFGDIKKRVDFTTVALEQIEIQSNRSQIWVSLDGEVECMQTPLAYSIHPMSLQVIVPRS